jgi:hypothetical protein
LHFEQVALFAASSTVSSNCLSPQSKQGKPDGSNCRQVDLQQFISVGSAVCS